MKTPKLLFLIIAMVLIICPVSGQTQMTFGTGGIIGIGTNTPTSDLEIGARDPVFNSSITDAVNLSYPKDICVNGNFIFVAGRNLLVVDISDPSNPEIIGISDANLSNPTSIAVAGKYVYVVDFSDKKFSIFDITDPSAPALMTDPLTDDSLEGCQNIHVSGKFAYVVSGSLDNLNIIDISDPQNPQITGTYTSAANIGSASAVYVVGDFAYVTALDNGGKLTVVDISDPSNPTFQGSVEVRSPHDIRILGRYAYVASYLGNSLEIIDISNPSTPVYVATFRDNIRLEKPLVLHVAGNFAYMTAQNYLTVIDISDPEHPTLAGSTSDSETLDDSEMPLTVSGRYAYVASKNSDKLSVFDIAGFESPAANIGSLKADCLDVTANAEVNHNLDVGTSLNVGPGGIKSDGPVSIKDVLTLTPRDSAPEKILGAIYFDNNDGHLYLYNGSGWKQIMLNGD